ncbi:hypothetical protein HG530_011557 [Fusarium avenaceum]|nr:hypothetical protein HG530_011557 [Fusarium avenaceum]
MAKQTRGQDLQRHYHLASVVAVDSAASIVLVVISGRSGVGSAVVIGRLSHLNRDDTAEGTSPSRILAADKTDVVLASNRASTVLSCRNRGNERVISLFTIAVAATLAAFNVGSHGDILPRGASAISVDHASVRASTVRVDLVDGHLNAASRVDLRKHIASFLHDVKSALFDIIVATTEGLTNGAAPGTISRSGGVNTEGHARAASVANSIGDDAVSSRKIGSEEECPDEVLDGSHFD